MIKDKYLKRIKEIAQPVLKKKRVGMLLFGSSVRKERFGDCDLGVVGSVTDRDIRKLQEAFEESTLPYKVDVVNFNKVSERFRDNVLRDPVLWLKRLH